MTNQVNNRVNNRVQRRATRDDWQLTPMPEQHVRLAWERSFSEEEYQRLCYGHIPLEMEDRWFIYMEAHGSFDELFFHRSWTGYCIYAMQLRGDGDGHHHVADISVNRDPGQYRSMSEASDLAILTEMLIDGLLLAKPPALDPDELLRHLRNVHGGAR